MKNSEAMTRTVETALAVLQKGHSITPVDSGKFGTVKVNGFMKFHVEQYMLERVGNVSVMRMKFGSMAMATVVVSPYEKNAPLMSIDYIFMMRKRKAYIEFYNLAEEGYDGEQTFTDRMAEISRRYDMLESCAPAPAWYDHMLTADIYKSGKAEDDATLLAMLEDHALAWMELCDSLPILEGAEQERMRQNTRKYADGLIDQGGVSTAVFKKSLGEETTREFFRKVFFGCGG